MPLIPSLLQYIYHSLNDNILHPIFRLVNAAENEELLKTVPHIPFYDMAIIFQCTIFSEGIEKSRNTTFTRYLVSMDIPMIGKTASQELERHFNGSLRDFELAAFDRFDFTCLPDFGETMRDNIHEWFHDSDHILLWRTLQKEFHFEERKEETIMTEKQNNPFAGCTIVATGKLENFTRDGINSKIISLRATAGSSITKKTDYLICGEKAGSKLKKAQKLGITVLTEQQFMDMISA